MNRCTRVVAALLVSAGAAALLPLPAAAQSDEPQPGVRQFPKNAVRGRLVIVAVPDIYMDGRPDRLSPSARFRDANNNLVLPGTLVQQRLLVNYVRDNIGLVQQVWVLNSEEARQRKPNEAPTGFLEGIRSIFAQPEASDDGNTPYDKLPAYKP